MISYVHIPHNIFYSGISPFGPIRFFRTFLWRSQACLLPILLLRTVAVWCSWTSLPFVVAIVPKPPQESTVQVESKKKEGGFVGENTGGLYLVTKLHIHMDSRMMYKYNLLINNYNYINIYIYVYTHNPLSTNIRLINYMYWWGFLLWPGTKTQVAKGIPDNADIFTQVGSPCRSNGNPAGDFFHRKFRPHWMGRTP